MADEKIAQELEALSSLGHLRVAFLTIHILGGLTGLPILILTLLLSPLTTPRQPALINFCITWALNSVAYTLTAFGGEVENASAALCFAQAAMDFGAPPMSGMASFLLVLQVWKTFKNPFALPTTRHRRFSENARLICTLSLPYALYIVFLLVSVLLQLKHPSSIDRRNGLYCTVSGVPFRRYSVPISSVIFLALIIGFEVSILLRYYSGRKLIASSFPLATSATSHGLIIRITLFNVYLVFTLSATAVFLSGKVEAWAYMIQASVPLAAFIVFATQKNVIRTWLFWLGTKEGTYSDNSVPPLRHTRTDDPDLSLPTLSMSTADASTTHGPPLPLRSDT